MDKRRNNYKVEAGRLLIDVSTETYPDTWTLVDLADQERVCDGNGRWFAMSCGSGSLYVRRRQGSIFQILQRFILSAPATQFVDHIDGDGLNNIRANIRLVSPLENMRNRKLNKNNSSGVSGVCWAKDSSKWQAQIKLKGKMIYLGQYDNIDCAIAARKAAEKCLDFHKNLGNMRISSND